MNRIIVSLSLLGLVGCSHLTVSNITKEGTEFNASAWSFCWDRNFSGFEFDYLKGTLGISKYKATPDKETLAKGLDMIKEGIGLVKQVAP